MQKERREMLRESSNVLIGIVLPVMLLIVFGFGMSLDVKNVNVAIVTPQDNRHTADLISHFEDSDYFTVTLCRDERTAADLLARRKVDAVVSVPQHPATLAHQAKLKVQVLMNGTNASMGRSYQAAVEAAIRKVSLVWENSFVETLFQRGLDIRSRMWFNDSNESSWFLVPGVIVIVMAIIGCMLTSLQVAKEYEHGTMESLFATPVSPSEILLAKMVNNYLLGMIGLGISLVFAHFVFRIPMHGSLVWIFLGSSLFMLSQMALGLVISSATKSQFVSAQVSTLVSFLPVMFLSGFIYEIPNMPDWLQVFTYILPARYFVEFLLTAFLAGDVATVYIRDFIPLLAFTAVFLLWARKLNPKVASS